MEYIASKIASNIRELEGALIRVTAFASLNRQGVDLSLAEVVLKDLIPDSQGPEITAATIMGATASYFGISLEDLCGSSRSRVLVTARQVAMYLCRELTDLSLPKIGQLLRRPRPHDGHARRPEDPLADGRAAVDLQPGHRTHQPHQVAGQVDDLPVGPRVLPRFQPLRAICVSAGTTVHSLGTKLWTGG